MYYQLKIKFLMYYFKLVSKAIRYKNRKAILFNTPLKLRISKINFKYRWYIKYNYKRKISIKLNIN